MAIPRWVVLRQANGVHARISMRLRRTSSALLGVLVLLQTSWTSTSWAWTLEGHRLIALDALAVLPPPMREALAAHVSAILAGVIEPDFFKVVEHKLPIVALRGTPRWPKSGAAKEIERLASTGQEMVRLGWRSDEVAYSPEMMLRLGGFDDVLFVIGQATHFVQDLDQPLHAAWGETRAEHNEIEAQMIYRSWLRDHGYRGFMLVKSYTCFAYEIVHGSAEHARALFFDREIRRVTEIAWDRAVNDTANLWQSVFWRALGPERASQRYGIPAPIKEIGNGSRC